MSDYSPIWNELSAVEAGLRIAYEGDGGSPGVRPVSMNALLECAQKMRSLCVRVSQFLSERIEQLNREIRTGSLSSADMQAVEQAKRKLESDRQRWEQQRQQLTDAVREEQQRLADAWEQIEQQQRDLMLQGGGPTTNVETSHRAIGTGMGMPAPVNADGLYEPPAVSGPLSQSGIGNGSAERKTISRELALLQFMQMKREMRKHALMGIRNQ